MISISIYAYVDIQESQMQKAVFWMQDEYRILYKEENKIIFLFFWQSNNSIN